MEQSRRIKELPVIVGSDYKRAALFFDQIVPIMWPRGGSAAEMEPDLQQYGEFRDALDTPFVRKSLLDTAWQKMIEAYEYLALARFMFAKIRRDNMDAPSESVAAETIRYMTTLMPRVDHDVVRAMLSSPKAVLVAIKEDPLRIMLSKLKREGTAVDIYGCATHAASDDSIDVMLSEIHVVQCENLSWEQVAEIRSDVQARKELNALRNFVVRNYKDCTKSYVEDELATALDNHQKAARKWGLTTLPSSIDVTCQAAVVISLLVAAGCIAFGAPLPVLTGTAMITPLAQGLLSIRQGRRKVLDSANVAYLVRLATATK
jgi:hypothetical protein